MSTNFEDLSLHPNLVESCKALGYTSPTEVQQRVIPHVFSGSDLIVSSQTGSGKTAAFLLPILHKLFEKLDSEKSEEHTNNQEPAARANNSFNNNRRRKFSKPAPSALILCPTRELAQQVAKNAIELKGKQRGFRVSTIVGGMPYRKQLEELQNCNLLVATPGRLLDLYSQRALLLSKVEFFVLDEADRMLDLGFSDDLHSIFKECSNIEQSLMFSATFPKKVMQLAEEMMTNPQEVALATNMQSHANIEQSLNWADDLNHQHKLLLHWLNKDEVEQCLIFASTQIETENLADELNDLGYQARYLHGGMAQTARNRCLDALRKNKIKYLVATDVAARGIDVATISHVINYGLPMKPEDYIHRIGRTGRAGRNGTAVTLANHRDRRKLRAIEDYIEKKLTLSEIPGLEPKTKFTDKPMPSNKRRSGNGGGYKNNGSGRPGGYRSSSARTNDGNQEKPRRFSYKNSGFSSQQKTSRSTSNR